MKKLLSVFIASLLVLTGLSFSSINQGNTASAKTKYKTTITYKGQKYVYVGHYKHHFSKKEVKKVVKFGSVAKLKLYAHLYKTIKANIVLTVKSFVSINYFSFFSINIT